MILNRHRGFTLLDVIITVAVLSFTLGFAVPTFQKWVSTTKSDQIQDQLAAFLRSARANAIEHQTFVTVCPLDAQHGCQEKWAGRIAMFEDDNRDQHLDAGEPVIRYLTLQPSPWLYEKKPASRGYFRWGPMGTADGTMGSVTFCTSQDKTTAKATVVSLTGRVRVSMDFNGDGIDEKSKGQALACP